MLTAVEKKGCLTPIRFFSCCSFSHIRLNSISFLALNQSICSSLSSCSSSLVMIGSSKIGSLLELRLEGDALPWRILVVSFLLYRDFIEFFETIEMLSGWPILDWVSLSSSKINSFCILITFLAHYSKGGLLGSASR